jgi:DNA-binding response OmpR family regulator
LFLKNKDFIKENQLTLQNFHVPLTLPIEILSFVEILNILNTKFIFFNNSKIIINNYEIDSNTKIIMKNGIKVKLTEKELELIFALNKTNGLDKSYLLKNVWKHTSDLDSHAFETNLHRLRKKMYSSFKDKSFIIEKKSLYYLSS